MFRRRYARLAAFAAIGWIAAECLLLYAATKTIGALPTFAFLTLKGLGGLVLLAISLKSVVRTMASSPARRGLSGIGAALFSAAGAGLILLPGLLTTFAGVSLFSPSVRNWVLRMLKGQRRRAEKDRILSLDRSEWSEIRPRGRQKPPKRRSIAP